jgi:hypothetical protein
VIGLAIAVVVGLGLTVWAWSAILTALAVRAYPRQAARRG